jgi:hypothetical protein
MHKWECKIDNKETDQIEFINFRPESSSFLQSPHKRLPKDPKVLSAPNYIRPRV